MLIFQSVIVPSNRRIPNLLKFVSETVFEKVSQKETFSTNQIAARFNLKIVSAQQTVLNVP